MEDITLQIHKTSKSNKASLTLEGTILIFNEQNKVIESETQIPIELITIDEGKRLKGSRLITGLLFPVISILVCVIIGAIFGLIPDDSRYSNAYGVIVSFVFLLSFIICIIFVIRFFFKVSVVTLIIQPDGFIIEFWKSKKDAKKVDEFIDLIKQRQTTIEKALERSAVTSIYTSRFSPIFKLIAIMFLFALPAIFTERPYLFSLVLLPVIWFVYKGILYLNNPKEYRQAMGLYIQKKWNEAIKKLEVIVANYPEYMPAYYLLIGIYIRMNLFDNALTVAANFPCNHQDLSQEIQIDIWYFKRLYERRKIQTNTDI